MHNESLISTSESETEEKPVSAAGSLWHLYREVSAGRMTLDTIGQSGLPLICDSTKETVTPKESNVINSEQDAQWITVLGLSRKSAKKK